MSDDLGEPSLGELVERVEQLEAKVERLEELKAPGYPKALVRQVLSENGEKAREGMETAMLPVQRVSRLPRTASPTSS